MTETRDPTALAPLVRVISDIWPSWQPSPGMLAVWALLLSDLNAEELRIAILRHAAKSTFPPQVADLRRIALTARGWDEAAQEASVTKLLGVAQARQTHREDLLDSTRDAEWRQRRRLELAERYGEDLCVAQDEPPPATPEERERHLANIRRTLNDFGSIQ